MSKLPKEAIIHVNGTQLTDAQSMTLRVAIEVFFSDLDINGCGDDDHGKNMVELYKARIREVRKYMYPE